MSVSITETELTLEVLETLIRMSEDWEAEQSCYGYRKNDRSDIEGNRIFLAKDGEETIGYLFGHTEKSQKSSSIMPDGTPCFEIEELYVVPAYRSKGIGRQLFAYAEQAVSSEAEYIMLSTATKDREAIRRFYDRMGMNFWSARLFKKLK
jgi:GNAT superfamily N-acetyltransferase